MVTPQRTVRQLRLSAPSRTQALALLPRLEDALRCASLPDDGARLLVVRRLALGRLRHDIAAGALSRLIEQRVQAADLRWVDVESPQAASADGVAFASVLDARIALALRLLQGRPAPEWYWPLAVPEAPPAMAPVERLRMILRSVAASPEARAALPAFAAALVWGGVGPRLAAVISSAEGETLLQAAGLAGRQRIGVVEGARSGPPGVPAAAARPPDPLSAIDGLPLWLQSLLPESAAPDGRTPAAARAAQSAVNPVPLRAEAGPVVAAVPDSIGGPRPTSARDASTTRAGDEGAQRLPPGPAIGRPAAAAHARSMSVRPNAPASAALAGRTVGLAEAAGDLIARSPWADGGAATTAGGLLFLLPLLARLGLPDWREPQGDTPAFTTAVLQAALHRLGVADDDPAWARAQACGPAAGLPRGTAASPEAWIDTRLAPLGSPPGWMARQLIDAPDAQAQAALWLDACRRWLRRIGGIGLASLVRRPARLALTASHADLFFRLDQTDLRVRRLGLDIDPGWLPWFGRVVAFHYRQTPR